VGDFNLLWSELTAADDLVARGVDVLMATTDNNDRVRERVHPHGVFTMGFYDDGRAKQGDKVLVSAVYIFEPIYLEFVKRVITGAAFGPDAFDAGLGLGVELTSLSPLVPLVAQAEFNRRLSASKVRDDTEEVFCGTLVDSDGTTRLNGTTGATSSGKPASPGERSGSWCLPPEDVHSMTWLMQGLQMPPAGFDCSGSPPGQCFIWVPPPEPKPPTPEAYVMSGPLHAGMGVLPGVTIALVAIFSVAVLRYNGVPVLRYSTPSFLLVINAGAVLYAASLFLTAYHETSDNNCMARVWTQGLGFALLFGALFAKTHRVHRLFNNNRLKRLRLTTRYVLQLLVVVLVLELALLLVVTFVFPPRVAMRAKLNADGSGVVFPVCGTGGSLSTAVDAVALVSGMQFLLLVWGAYLAFRTRAVPDGFNESKWMGLAIYNVMVCEVVGFIMAPLLGSEPQLQYYSSIIRLGVPPVTTLMLLYVPKAWAVWHQVAGSFTGSADGPEPGPAVPVSSSRPPRGVSPRNGGGGGSSSQVGGGSGSIVGVSLGGTRGRIAPAPHGGDNRASGREDDSVVIIPAGDGLEGSRLEDYASTGMGRTGSRVSQPAAPPGAVDKAAPSGGSSSNTSRAGRGAPGAVGGSGEYAGPQSGHATGTPESMMSYAGRDTYATTVMGTTTVGGAAYGVTMTGAGGLLGATEMDAATTVV
jgi:hypothetical protein